MNREFGGPQLVTVAEYREAGYGAPDGPAELAPGRDRPPPLGGLTDRAGE
jgi:hypothetical protein